MKKGFDVMKWLGQVRDGHYREQRELSVEQKLAATRAEAERFKASRPTRKGADPAG